MVRLTNKWLFYTSSFKYCTKQFRNYHLMDHWTQSLNELTESVRGVNQHQTIMALSDVIFYMIKWDILYCIQNLFKFTSLFSEFGWLTSKKVIENITILIILMHESTGQLIQIFISTMAFRYVIFGFWIFLYVKSSFLLLVCGLCHIGQWERQYILTEASLDIFF